MSRGEEGKREARGPGVMDAHEVTTYQDRLDADISRRLNERRWADIRFRNLAACIHAAAVEEMRCQMSARRSYDTVRVELAKRNIFIRSWS